MDNADNALPDGAKNVLWREAEKLRAPMVAFLQRLIQTPSLPGHEGGVAAIVAEEMTALGYDEVTTDEAGNVIGRIKATLGEPRRTILFNAHMDHVDVGDHSRWPYPPYEGVLEEGEVWGRATSDLKGSLAAQVYA